jgi:hypothetical protein
MLALKRSSDLLHRSLASTGLPPRIVNFALSNPLPIPSSPGANRNALLLHCAGVAFISRDDDSVCHVSDFQFGSQVAAIARLGWQLDTHFFDKRRDAVDAAPASGCDFLGNHEQLLGQQLAEIFPPNSQSLITDELKVASRVRCDLLQGQGHVGVTMSGVIGDSGIPNVLGLMLTSGLVRERLLKALTAHGTPEISRNFVRGVCRPTICEMNSVMTTTATGSDIELCFLLLRHRGAKIRSLAFFSKSVLQRCIPPMFRSGCYMLRV